MTNQPLFSSLAFARIVEKPCLAVVLSNSEGHQRLLVSNKGEEALCPASGPYMHYAFSGIVDHSSYFKKLPNQLRTKCFKSLLIRLPPLFYENHIQNIASILRQGRNSTEIVDINYHLPLDQSFIAQLPADQRRVLRLAKEEGYACSFSKDWTAIHQIVSQSRIEKGFADAISLELLLKLVTAFPDHYQGVVCKIGSVLAGAGVLIKVDEGIAYLFYVANHPAHLRFSPSLQIIAFCAEWASKQGFAYLDLGTGSKDGVVNEGVKRFKESIGGVQSTKSFFRIEL